eukprot:Nitzschia sp. Nitz4//scaffold27_size158506//34293//35192//NITZ4_002585-RA/size158506-snap-gene-0.196-mRNA-1//1//CDS//3329545443//4448//frame0
MAGPVQRKKKDKSQPTTSTNSAPANAAATAGNAATLAGQLDHAYMAIEKSRFQTRQLHEQWRTYMLRMSYVVLMVMLHQSQTPTTTCIKDIKHWNGLETTSEPIPGSQAMRLVLNSSMVEMLGVLCCACLTWCLSLPLPPSRNDFATLPYQLSCVLIPMIVTLYFTSKSDPQVEEADVLSKSCLQFLPGATSVFASGSASLLDETEAPRPKRTLPVALVFHVIASCCLWFMQYQSRKQDQTLEKVKQLQQDLTQAQKGGKSKK